ncbi:MAG: DUF47 family protein [Pseudomonadota bacterium]
MKELLAAFAKSPVPAIQRHAERCCGCVTDLVALVRGGDAELALARMDSAIGEAEELRRGIRHHVTRRLFLPISRAELRELVDRQHEIALRARTGAREFALRFAGERRGIDVGLDPLIAANEAIVAQLLAGVEELDELFASGFHGHELKAFVAMIDELDRLETVASDAHWEACKVAHGAEVDLSPVDAVMLRNLLDEINAIGRAADAAARQLELLITT